MNQTDAENVWVVIPAFNEETTIGKTIASILMFYPNIVVIDDCSTDTTWQKAYDQGVYVLHHAINLGQGAALQTGIEFAKQHNATYIVTFDADGQHDAAEITPMLHALQQSGKEIALGSRFLGKTLAMSWHRRLLLKLAIIFTNGINDVTFSDAHNGFRIMTRQFVEKFTITQNRMAHASEILNYIALNKIPFIEFPVTITYTPYSVKKGQTSANALRVLLELVMGKF